MKKERVNSWLINWSYCKINIDLFNLSSIDVTEEKIIPFHNTDMNYEEYLLKVQ